MKCKCGKDIDDNTSTTFGDLSECSSCAGRKVAAMDTAYQIRRLVWELYSWKGEEGMAMLKEELQPTWKEFGLR